MDGLIPWHRLELAHPSLLPQSPEQTPGYTKTGENTNESSKRSNENGARLLAYAGAARAPESPARPGLPRQRDLSLMREIDRQYLETPLLRVQADEGLAGAAWDTGEPEAGAAADARHGVAGHLPAAWHQPKIAGTPGYPYLLRNVRITRPNQVWAADITYLPMARGFLYLVTIMDWHSPVRGGLAIVQHPGDRLLRRGPERGPRPRNAGGVQHRPEEPVHQPRVHPDPPGSLGEDQHGRPGQVPGQHICRTAMADSEVRGGIPEGLFVLGRIEATGAHLDEGTKDRLTMAQIRGMPVDGLT